ncbi:MAG: hypothetical protein GXP49_14255 [Deltaproteobacteria bacterium]|nr:hypothetical protein [Deltaproteobacteria bacterium]
MKKVMGIYGRTIVSVIFVITIMGCDSTTPVSEPGNVVLLHVTCRSDVCGQIDKVNLLFSQSPFNPQEPPSTAKTIKLKDQGIEHPPFDVLVWAGEKLNHGIAIKGQGFSDIGDLSVAEGLVEVDFDPVKIVEATLCLARFGENCMPSDAGEKEEPAREHDADAEAFEVIGEDAEQGPDGDTAFEIPAEPEGDADTVDQEHIVEREIDAMEVMDDLDRQPVERERFEEKIIGCQAKQRRCDGDMLQECMDDNVTWKDLGMCDPACVNGVCVNCKPGDRRCTNGELDVCSLDGMEWNNIKTCEIGCAGNDCAVCEGGASECDETDPEHNLRRYCLEDGSGWRTETCAHGCLNDKCSLCRPQDDTKCLDKDTLLICNDSGEGWDTWGACCPPGSCLNDTCSSKAPYVDSLDPNHAKPWKDVDVTMNGCNFRDGEKILVRHGTDGSFDDESKFGNLYSEYKGPDKIIVHIKNLVDPMGSNDYYLKVRNPDNQESNARKFHVDGI